MYTGAMHSVGSLLRHLRNSKGLSQAQLARKAKVSREWVSKVESGERQQPEHDMLKRVAIALGEHPDLLLAAAGYQVAAPAVRLERDAVDIALELLAVVRRNPIMVRVVNQKVAADVLQGGDVVEQREPMREPIPYFPAPEERNHKFLAIEVTGDCLEPMVQSGHTVIVDRDAEARSGDVVVAIHEGRALIKILRQINNLLYLTTLRNDPPIVIDEDTRVLGVVKLATYRPKVPRVLG